MPTNTCDICHGSGSLPSGSYEDCYSCGGRGYGATTDTPCMACSGSGKSTQEKYDVCWQCHGIGTTTTSDPTPVYSKTKHNESSPKKTSQQKSTDQKASDQKLSDTIGGIALVLAIIVGVVVYQEKEDGGAAFGAGLVTLIGSGICLYIAYYVLKLAIEVIKIAAVLLFWGGIIVFVAYQMEAEWAIKFIDGAA